MKNIELCNAPREFAPTPLTRIFGKHARTIGYAAVATLMGFAATAFGLAPMVPDASEMPRRVVTESLAGIDVDQQIAQLEVQEMELFYGDVTRGSDTFDSLLKRLNISDISATDFLRTDAIAKRMLAGRSGKMVQVRTDSKGRLLQLVARYPAEQPEEMATHFTRLTVERLSDSSFFSRIEAAPLASQVRMGTGTIQSSLFAATDEAQIPDPIATQMAEIFSGDIDFHRELRKGDSFTVLFEAPTADGEPINWNQGAGRVLATEFINKDRRYSAVWFQEGDSKGGYFDFNGQSKRRSFLSSPMEFSRVTSGFAMRLHPILNTWRQHKGVDYGAPTGTPVRSVADGVVDFAGWQNGYGNVVSIKHSGDKSTLYAHLSRIDVKVGQKVNQGEHVGAVGATGWATGPHLHFELKVKGEQQDPLVLAKSADTAAIPVEARGEFLQVSSQAQSKLIAAQTLSSSGQTIE